MKRIYINRSKRAIAFGDRLLLPGSNVCEEIDPKQYPSVSVLVETTDDAALAAGMANTQRAAEEIAALDKGDAKVKEAATRRRRQLDELDAKSKGAEG